MNEYIQKRTENNAGLIYEADFYPLYTQRLWNGLSAEELIILSFIYYRTKKWNYIYATNENLAELTWVKVRTINKMIKNLTDLWYIETTTKTIIWFWTDRRLKYIWKIDGSAKNARPIEMASDAESYGSAKNARPKKGSNKAKSVGSAKNARPWTENKFVGSTCDYKEKCQNFGISSEAQNLRTYNNNIKDLIYFTEEKKSEVSDKTSEQQDNSKSTELQDFYMFDDGSIEFYVNTALQQSSTDNVTEVLRKLFPHVSGYKGSKKDVTKALKTKQLTHDFLYGLICDMQLLKFQCEYNLVKWPGFMSQRIDGYVPLTETQRDAQITRIVEYIKRHNQDKSLFEQRVAEIVKLIGIEKYRKIFRSIQANREDRVDLSKVV